VIVSGREDHWDGRKICADSLGELQAVEGARHLDIGEHKIDLAAGHEIIERLVSGVGLDDGAACCSQLVGDECAHKDFILDNEHMRFLAIQRRLRQHFDALLLSENGGLAVAFLAKTKIVAFFGDCGGRRRNWVRPGLGGVGAARGFLLRTSCSSSH